jgi:hypothetical protein
MELKVNRSDFRIFCFATITLFYCLEINPTFGDYGETFHDNEPHYTAAPPSIGSTYASPSTLDSESVWFFFVIIVVVIIFPKNLYIAISSCSNSSK